MQHAGPGPGRLPFVRQHAHHCLAQHPQADLGDGALEVVLGGQAVVEALVGHLDGADEEAVLRGEDTLTQLHLRLQLGHNHTHGLRQRIGKYSKLFQLPYNTVR